MDKRGIYILLVLLIFLIPLASALVPDPGHGASEVGPGTFSAGDYIFQGNLNVSNNLTVMGRVGVSTANPIGMLDFGEGLGVSQRQLYLYHSGNYRYGFDIPGGNILQNFVTQNGHITWGEMSAADGVTFSEKMRLTGGKLGIGTSNPNVTFQVGIGVPDNAGTAGLNGFINGSLEVMGKLFFSTGTASGPNDYIANSGNNQLDMWVNGVNIAYFKNGFANFNGIINASSVNTTSICISGDCKASWPAGTSRWNLTGNYLYPENLNYYVGIGTDNPTQRLHVEGNVNITGNLTVLGNMTIGVGTTYISSSGISTSGTITTGTIQSSGQICLAGECHSEWGNMQGSNLTWVNAIEMSYSTNTTGCFAGGSVQQIGNDCIHTFTANGTLNFTQGTNVQVLVVAGGGAGGGYSTGAGGGGGGAGGLIYNSSYFASGNITVKVGVGGTTTQYYGGNGSNSVFGTLTAIGGGGGGYYSNHAGLSGGSGGGGGPTNGPGGLGTTNQGHDGGKGSGPSSYPGGGGGGAGIAGADASGYGYGGDGGAGLNYSINGTNLYYAGGGGGGSSNQKGIGGSGIGGNGTQEFSPPQQSTAGVDGTGSGGGGAYSSGVGSDGGNGIVIVRYTLIMTNVTKTISYKNHNFAFNDNVDIIGNLTTRDLSLTGNLCLGGECYSSLQAVVSGSTITNVKPLVDRYGFGTTLSSSYVGVAAITPVTSGKNITIPSLTITGVGNLSSTYGVMRLVINYADGTSAASQETTFGTTLTSQDYNITLPEGYGATIKNITLELKKTSGTGGVNGTISANGWETPSTSTNVKPLVDRNGFGSTTSSSYVGVAAITPVTPGKNITISSLTITSALNTTFMVTTYGAVRFVINYADSTSAASQEIAFSCGGNTETVSKDYTITLPEGYGATIKNITLELKRTSGTGTVNGTISADGWETP
jgi:hypothetical protein